MNIDKILIVADDSPPSIKAIQYGFSLARDLRAGIVLLSIIEPTSAIGNVDAGIFPDDALITAKKNTENFLGRIKNEYGSGMDVELITSEGDIQSIVIDAAIQIKANLIVTGTHNRIGLNKLFNGSVAESIIHHSPVPVCVVPMGK
jgi:nucleotide-binding universal stress UspA family protein